MKGRATFTFMLIFGGGILAYAGIRGVSFFDAFAALIKGEKVPTGAKGGGLPTNAPGVVGGKIAELYGPWNDPADHGSHMHLASDDCCWLWNIALEFVRRGYIVSENQLFGSVSRVHTEGSYHYRKCKCAGINMNKAIDINWPDQGQERAKLFDARDLAIDMARVKGPKQSGEPSPSGPQGGAGGPQ